MNAKLTELYNAHQANPSGFGLEVDTKALPFLKGITNKRKCRVFFRTETTLHGLNWSGGSRSEYTAVNLLTGKRATPDLGQPAPWDNQLEGKSCAIPPNIALVQHGTFCGKPATAYVYINPQTILQLYPANQVG